VAKEIDCISVPTNKDSAVPTVILVRDCKVTVLALAKHQYIGRAEYEYLLFGV
jgi:hypothetical protein